MRHGWVWIIDAMKSLLETGTGLPPVEIEHLVEGDVADTWHRLRDVEANNSTWDLLRHRTEEENEDVLGQAWAAVESNLDG